MFQQFRRNVRAISPVLAVLMMIVIAVAGSLVTYAWVMGYLSFTTAKAGRAVQIQSIANSGADLMVYVQNVGEGTVELDPAGLAIVYVNGSLHSCTLDPTDGLLLQGKIATLTIAGAAAGPGERVRVRVVSMGGIFTESTGYPNKLIDRSIPQTGKRLGLWMQWITELQHITPATFYHTYFRTPPYFAALELIYPVWHDTYPAFVVWMDTLADLTDTLDVEIYVMLALDMGSNDHWMRVETALQTWSDNPSIYSVGVNGEHSKLHYPTGYTHAGFVQFQSLSHRYDKAFISYYSQNAPESRTKSAFPWIAHTNWPYREHRHSLSEAFDPNTQQVGVSAGLYDNNPDGYPDPDVPHPDPTYQETTQVGWNNASIQYMLDIGFTHDHLMRRCLIFAQLNLWDDVAFRQDVYTLSAFYPILMADPHDPAYTAS